MCSLILCGINGQLPVLPGFVLFMCGNVLCT